ncbi:hypothetical protein ACFCZ3_20130 [Cellulosimicrobium cellulans]|uniref:hypothetical protein n=1 Tax=Cellulosimicrobium cellulans TaxID=1710 RepID=UPI0035E0A4BB
MSTTTAAPARPFWECVDAQLAAVRTATTFDEVKAALDTNAPRGKDDPNGDYDKTGQPDRAFFPGSGGEATLRDALRAAGWRVLWAEASYHYVAHHPASGDWLHYIEGDVERADRARLLAMAERMEREGR